MTINLVVKKWCKLCKTKEGCSADVHPSLTWGQWFVLGVFPGLWNGRHKSLLFCLDELKLLSRVDIFFTSTSIILWGGTPMIQQMLVDPGSFHTAWSQILFCCFANDYRSWQDNTTISRTRLCFMWRANLTVGLQHNDYLNNISVVPAYFPPCIMFCWLKQNTCFWLSSLPFFVKGIWFSDLLSYFYSFCQTGHRKSRKEGIGKQIEWPRQSLNSGCQGGMSSGFGLSLSTPAHLILILVCVVCTTRLDENSS